MDGTKFKKADEIFFLNLIANLKKIKQNLLF